MSGGSRILLFTGEGKGKTTAALGMALRACGHDMPVLVVQFVKSRLDIGEVLASKVLPAFEILPAGLGFIPHAPTSEQFSQHQGAARAGLEKARQAIASGQYGLVILDEVCFAVCHGLLDVGDVVAAVKGAPATTCVVMTGRGAPQELFDLADTVTEMHCVKHGLQQGMPARKGVEM